MTPHALVDSGLIDDSIAMCHICGPHEVYVVVPIVVPIYSELVDAMLGCYAWCPSVYGGCPPSIEYRSVMSSTMCEYHSVVSSTIVWC